MINVKVKKSNAEGNGFYLHFNFAGSDYETILIEESQPDDLDQYIYDNIHNWFNIKEDIVLIWE